MRRKDISFRLHSFQMKSTRALSDGSEVENGYLTSRLKIRRNGSREYGDILLSSVRLSDFTRNGTLWEKLWGQ